VRIITATHKDLAAEVAAGRFREDLYYRLNVVEVRIPPLRERKEDIPLLAEYFLQRITRKNGMARILLSQEAIATLQAHHWPGNVRELENTMARACALASSSVLLPSDLPLAQAPTSSRFSQVDALDHLLNAAPAGSVLDWLSQLACQRAYETSDHDLTLTADRMGLSLAELKKWLKD
jgi:DNA-binding NtrC family response regulator